MAMERAKIAMKILADEAKVPEEKVSKICAGLSPEDINLMAFYLSGTEGAPLWAMGLVRDLRALQEEGRDESSGGR